MFANASYCPQSRKQGNYRMGTYRYQGQQNGKLQDRSTQTKPTQNASQDQPSIQDWSVRPAPADRQAQDKSGVQRWLKRGRWVGFAVKNLSVIVTGSVVLVSTVALFSVWRSSSHFLDDFLDRFSQPQPAPRIDMQPVLVQQLRNASELTTAIFAMQTVVPASRDRTLGGYTIGRTTLLYIAYGEVRAGVDLSALKPEDVQVNGNTINVRLPPPEILDSKIDVTRSKIYDYDRGFMGLGPDAAPELQEFAEEETLAQIVSTACTQGVLQSANERARLTVSQLLTTAGYASSTVETQSPQPETCTVTTPAPASTETSTPGAASPQSGQPQDLPVAAPPSQVPSPAAPQR